MQWKLLKRVYLNSYCYGCTNILGRSDQSPTFTFCDDGGRPFVTDYGAVSI